MVELTLRLVIGSINLKNLKVKDATMPEKARRWRGMDGGEWVEGDGWPWEAVWSCIERASGNEQNCVVDKYCHCMFLATSSSFVSFELTLLKFRETLHCLAD